ncbi:MAG: SDR family oxidoreductase [Bacteroidales bacterium]|nr:MAG: SDR family oxidoreductase [Bacteroidales bacterium]
MDWNLNEPFCHNLPTKANPDSGTILVTGATGYVGGRLVPELCNRGYKVRVLVRSKSPEHAELWPDAEITVSDVLNYNSLKKALKNVQVAYYLIHSMLLGQKDFELADIEAAINFRKASEENGVKRIIYLGALGDIRCNLSNHLESRIRVANELSKGKTPVTILRAAIILGSGSASFEIIKNLVNNVPVLLVPKWARTKCQPISIRDVVKYLVGVLEIEETTGKSFDIGGKTSHSYKEMLRIFSTLLHKKRIFINFFFSNHSFYGYITSLLTPVPAPIVRALIEGGSCEVLCQSDEIKQFLDFDTLSYTEAIVLALDREEQDRISTRWSDSYPPAHELSIKLNEIDTPVYTSTYSLLTKKNLSSLFNSICRIGGKEGWFHNNWMWRLRGTIDKLLMGVGTSRGRKSIHSLRINDVIDFWRIEDIKWNKRILLRAEMKLPGKAWLEFTINNQNENNLLSVNAYFQHKGILGKIYWYIFLPFHYIIFNELLKQIEKRS